MGALDDLDKALGQKGFGKNTEDEKINLKTVDYSSGSSNLGALDDALANAFGESRKQQTQAPLPATSPVKNAIDPTGFFAKAMTAGKSVVRGGLDVWNGLVQAKNTAINFAAEPLSRTSLIKGAGEAFSMADRGELKLGTFDYLAEELLKGAQDPVLMLLNTKPAKATSRFVSEQTSNLPLKLAARGRSNTGIKNPVGAFIAGAATESVLPLKALAAITSLGDKTYDEAYSAFLAERNDPKNPLWQKFLYELQDTGVQSAVGALLSLGTTVATRSPKAGFAVAGGFYTALSADEQLQKKGEVYSTGNIAIDVVGDSLLNGLLLRVFKEPSKSLWKSVAQGFGTEGSTEVAQSFLKLGNDYGRAKNEEEKRVVLAEAKDYVLSGGMAMEFFIGGVAGGVITGAGTAIGRATSPSSQPNDKTTKPKGKGAPQAKPAPFRVPDEAPDTDGRVPTVSGFNPSFSDNINDLRSQVAIFQRSNAQPNPETIRSSEALNDYVSTFSDRTIYVPSDSTDSPLMLVSTVEFPDGKFAMRFEANTSGTGFASEFDYNQLFDTQAEATVSAQEAILAWANTELETEADPSRRAELEKVIDYADNPRAPVPAKKEEEDGGEAEVSVESELQRYKDGHANLSRSGLEGWLASNVGDTMAVLVLAKWDAESSTDMPDVPDAVEDAAGKDWEENYADDALERSDKIQRLKEKLKTAKAAEKPALQKKLTDLQKEDAKIEDEFLAKWNGKGTGGSEGAVADDYSPTTDEEKAELKQEMTVQYHGTQKGDELRTAIENGTVISSEDGVMGKGFYVTTSEEAATMFGKQIKSGNSRVGTDATPDIIAIDMSVLKVKAVDFGKQEYYDFLDSNNLTANKYNEQLAKEGYDALNLIGRGETIIFDSKKVQMVSTETNKGKGLSKMSDEALDDERLRLINKRLSKELTPDENLRLTLVLSNIEARGLGAEPKKKTEVTKTKPAFKIGDGVKTTGKDGSVRVGVVSGFREEGKNPPTKAYPEGQRIPAGVRISFTKNPLFGASVANYDSSVIEPYTLSEAELSQVEAAKAEIKDASDYMFGKGKYATETLAEKRSEREKAPDSDESQTSIQKAQKARAEKALEVTIKYEGKLMTRAQFVEGIVAEGYVTETVEENKIKEMTRTQFNRADNDQQREHEKRIKEAGKKTVYLARKEDLSMEISKTEYDYANTLLKGETSKKYDKTYNVLDSDDARYLSRIFGEGKIADFKKGDFSHHRGGGKAYYEEQANANIVSETPKTIAQKLEGRLAPYTLSQEVVFHGTSPSSASEIEAGGFKSGAELPEDAFRGGGYGAIQESISFSTDPNISAVFTGSGKRGALLEVKIKKTANIVSIEGITHAEELNEYVKELGKQGVDAVYLDAEKEVVVLNRGVIGEIVGKTEFDVINMKKELSGIVSKYKSKAPSLAEKRTARESVKKITDKVTSGELTTEEANVKLKPFGAKLGDIVDPLNPKQRERMNTLAQKANDEFAEKEAKGKVKELKLIDITDVDPLEGTRPKQLLNKAALRTILGENKRVDFTVTARDGEPASKYFSFEVGGSSGRIRVEAFGLVGEGLEDGQVVRLTKEALKESGKNFAIEGKTETAGERTIAAFNNSVVTGNMGTIGEAKIVVGSYGINAVARKTADNKQDRIDLNEVPVTLLHVTEALKAGDSSFRKDNLVLIAQMPTGELRAIVTRRNDQGEEEVINFFRIGKNYTKFVENLRSYGIPEQTRTATFALEPRSPIQLAYGDEPSVPDATASINNSGKYQIMLQGNAIQTVDGEPVKIMDGIDTFIHKDENGNWVVSEVTSGRSINAGGYPTRHHAIENAKETLEDVGIEKTKAVLGVLNKKKLPKQPPTFSGGRFASAGMWSNAEELLDADAQKPSKLPKKDEVENTMGGLEYVHAVEMPELVNLARDLMGKVPDVVKKSGKAAGRFTPAGGGSIKLVAELFQKGGNHLEAARTLAHEIGHLIDWLDDMPKNIGRGNLLGRLFTLRKFMGATFSSEGETFSPEERTKIRNGITRTVLEEKGIAFGDMVQGKIDAPTKKAISNEVKKRYKKEVDAAIKSGGFIKDATLRKELLAVTRWWHPYDPKTVPESYRSYRESSVELYAEALSVLLNAPTRLKQMAPTFYSEFFDALDAKPNVRDAYFELQSLLSGDREVLITKRREGVQKMFSDGDYKALDLERKRWAEKEARRKRVWSNFKHSVIDKNFGIIDRVTALEKSGKTLNPDENPVFFLEERNYLGGKIKALFESQFNTVYQDVTVNNDIPWEQFGEYLFYTRIAAGDRSEVANPRGITPDAATELLADMQKVLGDESYEVLNRNGEKFRTAIKSIAEEAYKSGLYTAELFQQMQENPAYVTFQVLDHLEDGMTSRVYKSVGTLKDIANPADSSMLKVITTIRATERNNVTKSVVSFLEENFAAEIEEAKYVFNGKNRVPVQPKGEDQELVTFFDKGTMRGVYVDKYIAETINNESVGHILAQLSGLRFMNSTLFRPVFITFNLGFMSFNLIRDFVRFYKNIPDMTLYRAAKRYGQAGRISKVRAFGAGKGKKDQEAFKLLQQLEDARVFSVTFGDMVAGEGEFDSQVAKILADTGIKEFQPRPTFDNVPRFAKPTVKALDKAGVLTVTNGILDTIKRMGDFIETLPKAAGVYEYMSKSEDGTLTREQTSYIRRKLGSPDFLAGGTFKPVTNEVFLFSNAIIAGIRADIEVATDPKTRSAFWWKTAKVVVVPKLLMFAALLGFFGKELADMLQDASEYDRTNYTIIPLGKDENDKTIYFRLPVDESSRFIGGIVWKMLRMGSNTQTFGQDLADIASYTGGQLPSLSPTIGVSVALSQYIGGHNPYDFFRGRTVLSDDVFKAGGSQSVQAFSGWMFQQMGGGIFFRFYHEPLAPKDKSGVEKFVNMPLLGNVIGRFVRVSDFGQQEKLKGIQKAVMKTEAQLRIKERGIVNDYIGQAQERNVRFNTFTIEQEMIKEYLGGTTVPKDEAQARRVKGLIKKFRIGLKRGEASSEIVAIIDADSNEQKVAILKQMKASMSNEEYRKMTVDLLQQNIVSNTVVGRVDYESTSP